MCKDGSGNEGVQQYRAPVVISNAGIQPTVLKLAGEANFPADYVARVKNLTAPPLNHRAAEPLR